MRLTRAIRTGVGLSVVIGVAAFGWAHEPSPSRTTAPHQHRKPVRITMDELHKAGGVPPGWRFTIPAGDATAGRQVFAKLECFKCHEIKGEHFPHAAGQPGDAGPELTGMGSHHPAEYFAESIWDPNAVLLIGPGYTGPDGLSVMPDYRDSVTARELIDLVAYLKTLTARHDHRPAPAKPPHEGQPHGHK